jgi:hypothetical protein
MDLRSGAARDPPDRAGTSFPDRSDPRLPRVNTQRRSAGGVHNGTELVLHLPSTSSDRQNRAQDGPHTIGVESAPTSNGDRAAARLSLVGWS